MMGKWTRTPSKSTAGVSRLPSTNPEKLYFSGAELMKLDFAQYYLKDAEAATLIAR
jgi:DNA primase